MHLTRRRMLALVALGAAPLVPSRAAAEEPEARPVVTGVIRRMGCKRARRFVLEVPATGETAATTVEVEAGGAKVSCGKAPMEYVQLDEGMRVEVFGSRKCAKSPVLATRIRVLD